MKIPQTQGELQQHLNDQLSFLKSSCCLFDLGFESEAKRIAVTLRVLLSDSKNSKSLLTILDLKHQLPFYTWRSHERRKQHRENQSGGRPLHFLMGIALQFFPGGAKFDPHLSTVKYFEVTFEEWWNEIIFKNDDSIMTRSEIILSVADTDGGAHVDKLLKEGYFNFSRSKNVTASQGGTEYKLNSPAFAAIRQFAYEIEKTFDNP